MKRILSLCVLALITTLAQAGEAENMVAQCMEVMRCQLCRVALDQRVYDGPTIDVVLPPPIGKRKITVAAYDWIREPQQRQLPDGRFEMCVRVAQAMRAPMGDKQIAARSLFQPGWVPRYYCPPFKKP